MCDAKWNQDCQYEVESIWGSRDSSRATPLSTLREAKIGFRTEELHSSGALTSPTRIAPEFPCDDGRRLQNIFYRLTLK